MKQNEWHGWNGHCPSHILKLTLMASGVAGITAQWYPSLKVRLQTNLLTILCLPLLMSFWSVILFNSSD